jgi:hypothetical protein
MPPFCHLVPSTKKRPAHFGHHITIEIAIAHRQQIEPSPRRVVSLGLMSHSTALPAAPVNTGETDADFNEPALFWQQLECLADTHAAVFRLVVGHLEAGTAHALRGVNRAMRFAVNRAVTTVCCTYDVPFHQNDAGVVFREASCLVVDLQPPSATEAATFLSHISESSPELLARIQSLRMTLHLLTGDIDISSGSVAAFLSMCVPLDFPS